MKASLGSMEKYWIHQLSNRGTRFVSINFIDESGNIVDAWIDRGAQARAIAADLIKGAEYLEGIEPGQSVNEVDDLRQQLQAAQELNRTLSAQVEGWVSVDTAMPRLDECVDLWVGDHCGDAYRVADCYYDDERMEWWHLDLYGVERIYLGLLQVTHWMRQQEPPK